jgi:hypothetical protein
VACPAIARRIRHLTHVSSRHRSGIGLRGHPGRCFRTICAAAERIASTTSRRGCVPSIIVALRRRYLDATSSFHPSAAANSSGCLPNAFAVRVARRSRSVSLSATRQTMWSNRSHTATSFSADPQRNAVFSSALVESVSTSARLILQAKRSSQPAGVGYGGSLMTSPLVRSTQWLNPSKSASTANSPRLFRSAQTVDFPTPELPVTHANGIDRSSHGDPGHLGATVPIGYRGRAGVQVSRT